ncbi:MAG: multiheme c-type cytochrome [Prosthecobacter sp.]
MSSLTSIAAATLIVGLLGNYQACAQAISTLHPERVIGAERCEKCHGEELQAWKLSKHARSDSIHRDPKTAQKAKDIATKMGLRSVNEISTNQLCTECHFTRQQTGSMLKVIGGVSCESCHGGAKDWVDVHGDKEKIASHDERIKLAIEGGMLNPRNVYQVAENCFSCHVARNEKLINVGGHPARSEGFELASWSQGEVRHHFYTNSERHAKDNKAVSQNVKRVLFTTGLLLDLEHSLRGLAAGVQKGNQFPFRQAMGRRAYTIISAELPAVIEKLGGAGAPAELQQILAITKGVNLGGEAAQVIKAADDIKAQVEAFGQKSDGSALAGIDGLIPTQNRGNPFQPK